MLGVAAFFINARFRLPVVPVLIIFASYSIHYLIVAFRRNRRRFSCSLLLLVVLAFAVNYDYFTVRKHRDNHLAISHYTLGSALLSKNEKDRAIHQYELAYKYYKQYSSPSYALIAGDVQRKLGALYYENGDCLKAIRMLELVRGQDDQSIASMAILGDCYFKIGRAKDAVRIFAEILNMRPDYMPALSGLIQILAAGGDYDTAL